MRKEYAMVGLWIILQPFGRDRICRRILFFKRSTKTDNRFIGSSRWIGSGADLVGLLREWYKERREEERIPKLVFAEN